MDTYQTLKKPTVVSQKERESLLAQGWTESEEGILLAPTGKPDMNPEVTLPWDNKEDNKDQNEPSIEDTMIQAVLRLISLNCHLTIMFHEYGSSIFMDKVMATDLIGILGESSQIIHFISGNVDAAQKANK